MRVFSMKIVHSLLACGVLASQPAQAMAEAVKVVLDAGHGGADPGAVGVNGLYEKEVALDIVFRLRDELVQRGYEVSLTRDRDVGLTLAQRVEIMDGLAPDLFVSVHANYYKSVNARGSMVLYYDKDYPQSDYPASDAMTALTPESKRLAQLVQSQMVAAAGTRDEGLVPSAVYVARMGSAPSVLVETAFLSNPEEASWLSDGGFRQKLALGIADGITAYKPPTPKEPFVPGAFADISVKHWANAAVQTLKNKGIVQGEYGKFFPERALTRAEFVVMLERQFPLSGSCGGAVTVTGSTYGGGNSCSGTPLMPKDLSASHWAYTTVMKAVQYGLLSGYSDGTVQPDRPLSRGEAAALIDRVIYPNSSQTVTQSPFSDVPKSLWSAAAISRLKAKGIIEGATATTFAPERPITRAEMSALLARLIK